MDRRTVWAILLMMVIAIAPALFLKKPAAAAGRRTGSRRYRQRRTRRRPRPQRPAARLVRLPSPTRRAARPRQPRPPSDTVRVTSPLYTYGISTRGAEAGRGEAAPLPVDGAGGQRGDRAEILPAGQRPARPHARAAAGTRCASSDWDFTAVEPTALSVVGRADAALRLAAERGGMRRRAHLHLPARRLPGRRRGTGHRASVPTAGRCWSAGPDAGQHRGQRRGEPPRRSRWSPGGTRPSGPDLGRASSRASPRR